MSDAFVIEVQYETVGIVVRQNDERSFRFHAALPRYYPMDGQVFDGPRAAERAAVALRESRRTPIAA